MKKLVLKICLASVILFSSLLESEAITYKEAYSQTASKPMILLIYANWAENYQNYLTQLNAAQRYFGQRFNFVALNICTQEAKEFTENHEIYPKLPYILYIRNEGKISRYIPRSCAADAKCVINKITSFIK